MQVRKTTAYISFLIALLGLCVQAYAQTSSGVISGRVVDPQGAGVPGAEVMLIEERTAVKLLSSTDPAGTFVFPSVLPGRYALVVNAAGFRKAEMTGVLLSANERLSAGVIQLEVGALTESVTVTAEVTPVQTASGERSGLLNDKQMLYLSAPGRDFMNLLKVLPGVTYPDGSGASSLGTSGAPIIHGVRSDYTAINLDGVVANNRGLGTTENMLNLDAIAEVKVLQGSYQAEFGKNAGSVINVVSKNGGQEFHGTGYWYKRHEMFNANSFFNNFRGVAKPRYRYTTVGYNVSGPVYWGGRFNQNRDKLFFFFSQEIQPNKTPSVRTYTFPTELERKGDFSKSLETNGSLIVVRDPLTKTPLPGNVIPASQINANTQKLLGVFPMPNFFDRTISKGTYNAILSDTVDRPARQEILRVDYSPSPKWRMYFRGMSMSVKQDGYAVTANSNQWGIRQTYETTNPNIAYNLTYLPGPTLVNELSVGLSRWTEIQAIDDSELAKLQKDKLGIQIGQFSSENNPLNVVPAASFGGVSGAASIGYDGRFPMDNYVNAISISDSLTKVLSRHTIKAGIYYELAEYLQRHHGSNFAGNFNFGRTANNPFDSNHPYANALFGYFQTYSEVNARPNYQPINKVFEWFVQDNWRTTSKLTLDYGLRFTYDIPAYPKNNAAANFDAALYDRAKMPVLYQPVRNAANQRVARNPLTGELAPAAYIGYFVPGSGDPFTGAVTAGTPGYPRGFVEGNGLLVAPRFGFAYDPYGDGKTSIRGAAGLFYNARPRSGQMGDMTFNPPIRYTPTQFYGSADTFLNSTGLLTPLSFSRVLEREANMPVIHQMNIGIERNIGFGTVIDVAYAGNLGRNLGQTRGINNVPYGARFESQNIDPTTNTPLNDNFFRPYFGWSGLPYMEFAGNSSYHSMQTQVKRRFAKGFQFNIAWTWSKAMNYGDDYHSGVASYNSPHFWNYGPAGYDRTHTFTGNWVWDLPKASGLVPNPLVRWVFDNWQCSGIVAFVSGPPEGIGLTLTDGADLSGGGDGVTIVQTGKALLPKDQRTFSRYFDTGVFRRPARGERGSGAGATRYAFRGPGINNWDLTFFKNFPIREKVTFQFRWEMYNAFNHTQFSGVDTGARFNAAGEQVNTQFGQINGSRSARVQQMSLRLSF